MAYPGVFDRGVRIDNSEMCMSGHMAEFGITIAKDAAAAADLAMGQAMGKITATGKYAKYDNTAANGTEVMVGILSEYVDITKSDQLSRIIVHGFLKESKCVGVDAAGKVDVAGLIKFF